MARVRRVRVCCVVACSVSTMLHCQMMRDVDAPEKKKKMLPFFCEENYTGKQVKEVRVYCSFAVVVLFCFRCFPCVFAVFSHSFPLNQRTHEQIPAVKQIYTFLKQVFEVGQFNPECCVISLVYINRLIGVTGVPLTQSNWKPGTFALWLHFCFSTSFSV